MASPSPPFYIVKRVTDACTLATAKSKSSVDSVSCEAYTRDAHTLHAASIAIQALVDDSPIDTPLTSQAAILGGTAATADGHYQEACALYIAASILHSLHSVTAASTSTNATPQVMRGITVLRGVNPVDTSIPISDESICDAYTQAVTDTACATQAVLAAITAASGSDAIVLLNSNVTCITFVRDALYQARTIREMIATATTRADACPVAMGDDEVAKTKSNTPKNMMRAIHTSGMTLEAAKDLVTKVSLDDLITLSNRVSTNIIGKSTSYEIQCKFEELNAFIVQATTMKDTIKSLFDKVSVSVDVNSEMVAASLLAMVDKYNTLVLEISTMTTDLDAAVGTHVHLDAPTFIKVLDNFDMINTSISTYFNSLALPTTAQQAAAFVDTNAVLTRSINNNALLSTFPVGPNLSDIAAVFPSKEHVGLSNTAKKVFAKAATHTANLASLHKVFASKMTALVR